MTASVLNTSDDSKSIICSTCNAAWPLRIGSMRLWDLQRPSSGLCSVARSYLTWLQVHNQGGGQPFNFSPHEIFKKFWNHHQVCQFLGATTSWNHFAHPPTPPKISAVARPCSVAMHESTGRYTLARAMVHREARVGYVWTGGCTQKCVRIDVLFSMGGGRHSCRQDALSRDKHYLFENLDFPSPFVFPVWSSSCFPTRVEHQAQVGHVLERKELFCHSR